MLVGGGWIGLEVAAAAREAGADVTILEVLELPLVRLVGPEVAHVFADLHREQASSYAPASRWSASRQGAWSFEVVSGGRVVAGMHVNDWDAIDQVRRLVGHHIDVPALRERPLT